MLAKTANLMSGHLSDKQKAANKREFLKAQRQSLENHNDVRAKSVKAAKKVRVSSWKERRHAEFVGKYVATGKFTDKMVIRVGLLHV